jgi:chromosome partitioning protein
MGKVISCVNQKGGVGKSATATNLGAGLVKHGYKVLVVDLDAQASQTISLGWKEPDELPVTIATLLKSAVENREIDTQAAILHNAEGIDLIPSSIELSGVEMRMINAMSREFLLKGILADVKADYDYVILDCAPTLGIVTINALAASDSLIAPVQPEYLSVIGMTQLFDTVGAVKKQINPELQVEGVLITLANMRTNLAKNTVEIVRQAYGDNLRIYSTPIPYSTKIKEASAAGKSIFAYEPRGKAAYAYEKLVEEVERNGRQRGSELYAAQKAEPCR